MKTAAYDFEYLVSLISENKKNKIEHIIQNRTRHITVVLENIAQPHNASAVLRSCDIFGVQDIHIIESKRLFVPNNEIAKGASKWLSLYYYPTTISCVSALRHAGYQIIATSPHATEYTLDQFSVTPRKIALLFGTELDGLSQEALSSADAYLKIPMFGFTESFNISVSASICLYELILKLRSSLCEWRLTPQERKEIQQVWVKRILGINVG